MQQQGGAPEEDSDSEPADAFFEPSLFLNERYNARTFSFLEHNVTVEVLAAASTDFDLTGQVVWPATQRLGNYIVAHQDEFRGSTVLEVGSGIGVTGILAAMLGSKDVLLTDNVDVVLRILARNIESVPKCSSARLDWGNIDDINAIQERFPSGFNLIIGSDVVFWQSGIVPLLETVSILLSTTPESKFLLCYQSRAHKTDAFLLASAAQQGFNIVEEPPDPEFKDIKLFVFTKINR